jgi:hypothetical protein
LAITLLGFNWVSYASDGHVAIIVNIRAFPTSAFILLGWVFKFYPMVYEKHITLIEKDCHEINSNFWDKKEYSLCHKMEYVFFLPKCVKQISRSVFICALACLNAGL